MSDDVYALPLLLQEDRLNELNDNMFSRTGCFAFTRTEWLGRQAVCAPTGARDAFTVIVIGLYALYKDCGTAASFLLNRNMWPVGSDITRLGRHHVQHMKDVDDLRHNIAHGNTLRSARDAFMTCVGYPGRSYMDGLTEAEWDGVVRGVVRDSDALYDILNEWARAWEWEPQKAGVRQQFADKMRRYPLYTGEFYERLMKDFALKSYQRKHHMTKVEAWNERAVDIFLNAGITGPEDFYLKLKGFIWGEVHEPPYSSVDLAIKKGMGQSSVVLATGPSKE